MKVKYYDLENKRVFITGGGSGIGASIVEHFCEQGSEVYFIDIKVSEAEKLIEDIKSIIKENDIKGIIVGNPINMDGSYGKSSQSAKDTAINLADKINIPVCLWDERLSTVGAFNMSSELDINVSKRVKDIDKFAAAFILQGALDYLQN